MTTPTIFIDKPGTFLGKKSRRIVIRTPEGDRQEYPLLKVKEITVVGKGISFSTDLLYQAVKLGVRISFVDRLGRYYVTVASPYLTQTIETARAQMREYNTQKRFELAKAIVLKKIRNQAKLIKFFLKKNGDMFAREKVQMIEKFATSIESIGDTLRGEEVSGEKGRGALFSFEGRAANLYWSAWKLFLEGNKIEFPGRTGRGAKDPVNALLNYGYAMLFARIETVVLSCGFLPFAGFLHADRPGKPSFVLDAMELFRQPIVDHTVLEFIFDKKEIGEINGDVFKDFAQRVQGRLASKLAPVEGKRYEWQYVVYLQIQSIASFLKGEAELNIYEGYGDIQ